MIGSGTTTDEHVLPFMGDEALGIITAPHYSAALDTPANRTFRAGLSRALQEGADLLSRAPHISVITACQFLGSNRVNVVTQGAQCCNKPLKQT